MVDVREIKLGKWYIPKKRAVWELEGEQYHTVGYFDIIEAKPAKNNEKIDSNKNNSDENPLVRAFKFSDRLKTELQSDYFVQEIKAFTTISEDGSNGFTKDEIEKFWGEKSEVLCLSMVHLYLEIGVDDVLKRIKTIFEDKNYLYYFTFDYSSIIILAKNITIQDYVELLFQVNYYNDNDQKLVKDVFSIYSYDKAYMAPLTTGDTKKQMFQDNNLYDISVNVGIRDYSRFEDFKRKLTDFEKRHGYNSVRYRMLGRHDVSIVNTNTKLEWLRGVQQLLNNYTEEGEKGFFTYESFVKVRDKEVEQKDAKVKAENEITYILKEPETGVSLYADMKQNLNDAYYKIIARLQENNYSDYQIPIKEVCTSIFSIIGVGFAEEFVICMYQSFFEFLQYLDNKMIEEQEERKKEKPQYSVNNYREEFNKCFIKYFSGLSSLVNSTMHTDRQFIHATSFGAIFYDVPPKLMAFYVAMVNKLQKIMKEKVDKKYTFLLTPSFLDEINVQIISYNEKMPTDRILQVSISEKSLYNPNKVIRIMAHEIAHFVGTGLRKRDLRKEKIVKTLVSIILLQILQKDFPQGESLDILKNRCVQIVDNRLKWNGESNNYLQNLKPLYKEILEILSFDFVIQREIKDYILKTIESTWIYERNTAWDKKNYIEQLILHENGGHGNSLGDIGLNDVNDKKLSCIEQEILAEFVCKDIKRELLRLRYPENEKYNEESIVYQVGDTILQDHLLEHYSQTLLSLYSETYADLQMILVLNISYEEYLKGFVCDEDVKINDITRCNEHINRISTIADLMMQKGIWQETVFENPKVNTFAHIIKANIDKTHQEGSLLSVQNQSLYEYLETCLEVGKEHYALSSQEPEIEEVRKIVGIMKKYDDAQQVYTKVCELLSEYREELAKLSM